MAPTHMISCEQKLGFFYVISSIWICAKQQLSADPCAGTTWNNQVE